MHIDVSLNRIVLCLTICITIFTDIGEKPEYLRLWFFGLVLPQICKEGAFKDLLVVGDILS